MANRSAGGDGRRRRGALPRRWATRSAAWSAWRWRCRRHERVAGLALVNAWAAPNPHTARCFASRLRLLAQGGPRAYVEAQPIFLYPAAWAAQHHERVNAEVEHGIAHFQGEGNLRKRIKPPCRSFDIDARLGDIAAPTLVAAAKDDVLVPWTCSLRLADGLPHATLDLMAHGGHAHSVTEADAFNSTLLAFLSRVSALAIPA
jgi:aminoacrylate hydrolase